MNNIYLSIVAASRNDNHGGKLDERTNAFIKSLAENCKKYKIPSELILVEWNQIPDAKSLSNRLNLISNEYLNLKIITVSKDHHLKLQNSDKLQFYQMIAKNVGIRRASGEFILATNIDVIINQKLYEFISNKKLKKKTIYRCNRHCIDYDYNDNFDEVHLNQFTKFIDKKYYSLNVITNEKHYVYSSPYKYLNLFFDLIFRSKYKLRNITFKKLVNFIKNKILSLPKKIFFVFKNLKLFQNKLFTNACGDFTLLDKNSWLNIGGYCELPIYSWHLDSLFLWEARFKKYKFYDFKDEYYIYHMNHFSSGMVAEKKNLFEKLDKNQIPYLTNEEFLNLAVKLSKNPNYLKTDDFWGLHNKVLN